MRITYRKHNGNKDYWQKRWSDIPVDKPMSNTEVYPLKYAEMTVSDNEGKILEAGCGNGRILRFYKNKGYDIVGIDFIKDAIHKLQEIDPELKVSVDDITKLQFDANVFKYVLAFGLFHNLENGLERAIQETYRVLEPGGKVCASFRADNIQTRLTDWLSEQKNKRDNKNGERAVFHKLNLKRSEFIKHFERCGFTVKDIYPVENMPLLYKFALFRAQTHKKFNENIARKEGYQLSAFGNLCQGFLMRFFPNQFCNIYVLIAEKNNE